MAEISDDDLGILVICAVNYDSRLPYGHVKKEVWDALTPEWRERVLTAQAEAERRRLPVPERMVRIVTEGTST